jgi:hypothetical protein
MTDRAMLTLTRHLHNFVYVVMAVSVFAVLYAALSGARGWWLTLAVLCALAEVIVYVANGWSCPLTQMARRYGAGETEGYALDTCLSPRVAGLSFRFLVAVGIVGLVLLIIRSR